MNNKKRTAGPDITIDEQNEGGSFFEDGEPMIDLMNREDCDMLKRLYEVVQAYQYVSDSDTREEYLK